MRADLEELYSNLESPESAHWVLCRDDSIMGFQFSTDTPMVRIPEEAIVYPTGQRFLYGDRFQKFHLSHCTIRESGHFKFFENGNILIGVGRAAVCPGSLEAASFELYKELLGSVGERSICRIWNYVPAINETHPGLMENYKLFCSGRSKAFEWLFGSKGPGHFPAASATGSRSGYLTIVFIATRSEVIFWENPQQTPTCQYPSEYGPRPPAFARASRFIDQQRAEWIFVSGTAAIKGYNSLFKGDFSRQLDLTLENVDLVLRACGRQLSDCDPNCRRHIKSFLRNERNLAELLERLRPIMRSQDSLTVVEGDICRRDLEVEIELTVFPVQRNPARSISGEPVG